MAAYASLLSLGHTLDLLLQHPPRQRTVLDKAQIDSLRENITFLQEFLENFSLIRGDEIQGLEGKIARSAYEAEDIIASRVADQILEDSEAERRSSTLFSQDLQKVIEAFRSMKKDVIKIKETEGIKIMQQPKKDATAGSFVRGASDSKNTMVGFDEDLTQIMEKLTGHTSNLRIISIVGMGGIGKTTLARNVYQNPCIVEHFHVRAWVTISQQYSVNEILSALLSNFGLTTLPTEDDLGGRLYRRLSGIKYLIVMDDLWSIECWNDIKMFFPDNKQGSRVMVTTRLSNVADDFRSCTPHQLHLLDEDESWALFCDKVFGKESCPDELEEVAKIIVRNCGRLPLAIIAISGLLAKSSRTVEYWEYVANDTHVALSVQGDCFEILSLSYKYLPVHLKPCFLYMAIFPEDQKIRTSRLIKLWVAEGILKPIRSKSLEEIAEDNIKDLIDRNLIQVHEHGSRNKIKICTIHDLLRDVCLRESRKEKFLCVTMMHSLNNHSRIIGNKRWLIIRPSSDKEECEQPFFDTRSKLHRLLRELNRGYICSYEEIVRFVGSRYIDIHPKRFSNLSNTLEFLSFIWNLQSVTIVGTYHRTSISLPAEIWEMPQLMHLKMKRGSFYLPDPPCTNSKNGRRDFFVLKKLQTLYTIKDFRCTDEVVHRIPNLKKLRIIYRRCRSDLDYQEVHNLSVLRNLESLFLNSYWNVLQYLCFPHSLKKLTLQNCGVCWEDLTVVGSLSHLEVLNLMYGAVGGREWNPVEGQFLELKSLRIMGTDLVEWIADNCHFPRLEKLELVGFEHLKEIPYGIGEIQTLESISLTFCSDSANSSANKIQEGQQNLGNHDLQVSILDVGTPARLREFYKKQIMFVL